MARAPQVGFLARYGLTLGLLLAGTLALLVVLARGGVDPSQAGRAYLLTVGAIVLFHLVQELRRTGSFFPQPQPPASGELSSQLPADLVELQDALRASGASSGQFELQVLPVLREIAADRLLLRGISLRRDPERAGVALGREVSVALRVGSVGAEAPAGRGLRRNELDALLDALEEV